MPYLFLTAFCFILLILLLQKLEHTETRLLVQTLKWTMVGVMVLAAIYLTLVGRLLHVAALAILLILLLKKDMQVWKTKKAQPLALSHPMTQKEAASLLKIDLNASAEEIDAAFKKIKPKDSVAQDRLAQARNILLNRKNT